MTIADWSHALWPEWSVVNVLGNGAFGTVYQIRRQDMGGTYYAALKVISFPNERKDVENLLASGMNIAQIADYYDRIAANVAREFSLMERLKGRTNIVSYEDHKIIRRPDGIGWLILIRMELLSPLSSDFLMEKVGEQEIIRLGCDICRALEDCRQENVIHRDLKPANIFRSSHGDFKLGDFGIAVSLTSLNRSDAPCGTYSFMAPEVYYGRGFDPSVDTYALGLVLYRMLNCGRAPFLPLTQDKLTQEMVDCANQARWSGAVLPRPVHGSEQLVQVVLKACSHLPEQRFRSAQELRLALESCKMHPQLNHPTVSVPMSKPEGNGVRMERFFTAAGDL